MKTETATNPSSNNTSSVGNNSASMISTSNDLIDEGDNLINSRVSSKATPLTSTVGFNGAVTRLNPNKVATISSSSSSSSDDEGEETDPN